MVQTKILLNSIISPLCFLIVSPSFRFNSVPLLKNKLFCKSGKSSFVIRHMKNSSPSFYLLITLYDQLITTLNKGKISIFFVLTNEILKKNDWR